MAVDVEELAFRNSVFESILSKIHTYRCVTTDTTRLEELLLALDSWYWAQQDRNGTKSDDEVKSDTDKAFNKVCELALL